MYTILLALALLAGEGDGEIAIVSAPLGIGFSCPSSHCKVDSELEFTPGGIVELTGVEGFSLQAESFPAELSLEAAYKKELARLGETYTLAYKRLKPGAFGVLSGRHGDEIVYEKLLRARSRVVSLTARYSAARKAELDPVVARLMSSYQRSPGDRMAIDADKAIAAVLALPEVSTFKRESGAEALESAVERSPLPGSKPHSPEARFRIALSDANASHSNIRFEVDAFDGAIFGYVPACDAALPLRKWRQVQKQLHQPGFDCRDLEQLAR